MGPLSLYIKNIKTKPRSIQIIILLQAIVMFFLSLSHLTKAYASYLEFQFVLPSQILPIAMSLIAAILYIFYDFIIRIILVKERISWVRYLFCLMFLQQLIAMLTKHENKSLLKELQNSSKLPECLNIITSMIDKAERHGLIAFWSDVAGITISAITLYFFFQSDVTLWLKGQSK